MDSQQENELLIHIATGTDPLTALAAISCDDQPAGTAMVALSTPRPRTKLIELALLVAIPLLMLLR